MLRINDTAPDFRARTTDGTIQFHDWIGDGWAVLFSHPKDFTPICTTELSTMVRAAGRFTERNCKVIALSVDTVEDHQRWTADVEQLAGRDLNYPIIGDPELEIARAYGMLPADIGGDAAGRTAMDNATARSVFVIGPDKRIKAMIVYPMTSGRNFEEILRLLDSCQKTAVESVATPANWQVGDDVVILPSIDNETARARWPEGWSSPLPYLRMVADRP